MSSRALYNLQNVPGIGFVRSPAVREMPHSNLRLAKAKKLVEAGCMTVSDLTSSHKFSSLLSKSQLVRLKYLNCLDHPLSRLDIEDVQVSIHSILSTFSPNDGTGLLCG